MDYDSQRRLMNEVGEKLSETEMEFDEEWRVEIKRRIDKIDRGEATFVSEEEFFARGRTMIEEAKRAQK